MIWTAAFKLNKKKNYRKRKVCMQIMWGKMNWRLNGGRSRIPVYKTRVTRDIKSTKSRQKLNKKSSK